MAQLSCVSELTWKFVVSLVRAVESVNKGVIICELKLLRTDMDFSTPSCVSRGKYQNLSAHFN